MSRMHGSSLVHQAFLYKSPEHFVASMAPFVRQGLERDESVFAATTQQNIDALCEELGDDADRLEIQDTREWQTHPYERLQAFKRIVAGLPRGGSLRAMGEPVWEGSDAVIRQWARYESIINAALADAPMRFVCLYDASALPDRILDYAVRTHPQRIENGHTVACATFVPPEEFVPGSPLDPPPSIRELPLEGSKFRHALAGHAIEAGIAFNRVEEFVLAANEVVTNAVRHGEPPVRANVWVENGELICRVSDSGAWKPGLLAGWLPPDRVDGGGWGLPIARQLCDALEITPTERGGTAISLHLSLADRSAGARQLATADQAA